ncbi:nitronate monooxygenase family protein [soil metagenome]
MAAWPDRRFLAMTGASVPIVQAPMAGSGGVAMAIGAIRGGGVGSLPCALIAPDAIAEQVVAVRAAVAGPINLNFFCHILPDGVDDSRWIAALALYYREYDVGPPAVPPAPRAPFDAERCAIVEAVRPDIVSFHFGLPDETLLARVKATGALVLSSATTVAEARWLAARGVNMIIAQGFEAGGHSGRFLPAAPGTEMGLFALLPQIVDAVDVPVIAAGGMADARGMVAALALGASAVQLGTAYLLTPESFASPMHRAALQGAGAEATRLTNMFTGRLARGLPNRLLEDLGPVHPDAPPFPHAATALTELRTASEARGEADFSPLWSGQAALLARPMTAEGLTRSLGMDAQALMARWNKDDGDA